ncbi:MAG TPA: DUF2127 domain-containing protein [Steroidobacteraceae bacterium]|nr:DUF2127 domain-containing protein [Steroidobacteraceae bacterium]
MRANWTLLWHRAFIVGIVLKGVDGVVELVAGGALLLTTRPAILHAVTVLTRGELIEDPGDFVANHLLQFARHLSLGTREFAGAYLLAQGFLKIILATGLVRGERWAYPVAVILMLAFIVYQVCRIWQSPGWGFEVLTLLDTGVVLLIVREWRRRPAPA